MGDVQSENQRPDILEASLDRRSVLRAIGIVGVSGIAAPLATARVAVAVRTRRTTTTVPTAVPRTATLRIGVEAPQVVSDPRLVATAGERLAASLVGDYLCATDASYRLVPRLATAWRANDVGTEWTFTLRSGVTFHDGSALDADDVVATFRRIVDGDSTSAAQQLAGLVLASGITKTGPLTVRFRLLAPSGTFPYLVSSENSGAVITPTKWTPTAGAWFVGTGERRGVTAGAGGGDLVLLRARTSWRAMLPARLSHVVLVPVTDAATAAADLAEGRLDLQAHVPHELAPTIVGSTVSPGLRVQVTRTAAHSQIHMRTDQGPFVDVRVRTALALAIDRPGIVRTHMNSFAEWGADSPIAPALPAASGVTSTRDITRAKALMRDANVRRGFNVTLSTTTDPADVGLADTIAEAASQLAIRVTVAPSSTYFDSEWLASDFGLTRYAHRGNPCSVVSASLASDGPWNAAHYRRPPFDDLVRTFATSLDLSAQRRAAADIGTRLLRDRPIIVPFFEQRVALFAPGLAGLRITALDQLAVN